MKKLFVFIFALMLGGCGFINLDEAMKDYKGATPCCDDISKFKYDLLEIDTPYDFRIDRDSKAFIFKTGTSYFRAFKLPKISTSSVIHIKSYNVGPRNLIYFFPTVLVLDKKFSIIQKSNYETFDIKERLWNFMHTHILEGGIKIDNPAAKYLVILTDSTFYNIFAEYHRSYNAKQIQLSRLGGTLPPVQVSFSPFGSFTITIFTADPTNAIAKKEEPYIGKKIKILAPQKTGYRLLDKSDDKLDHFIFGTSTISGTTAIAFAQCYKIGLDYAKYDAEKTLKFVTEEAVIEHSKKISGLDYKLTDKVIGTAKCKRIDFNGKYIDKKKGLEGGLQLWEKGRLLKDSLGYDVLSIVGYDILCIHPEWNQALHPFVVRIGANMTTQKPTKKIPDELESFFQNVTFQVKN